MPKVNIFKKRLYIKIYKMANIKNELEIWKIIKDNNNYEISSYGNIRNLKTKRILKYQTNYGGYNYITLLKKTYYIHRLVACAFIENADNKPTINHINKIRNDNYYQNLEWATHKEQFKCKDYININSNNNRIIYQLDKNTENIIEEFMTIKDAAFKITNNKNKYKNISLCALGKIKTAYGYKWKYKENINLLNEQWKFITIRNKENIYQISNYGRIKNNKTNRILKQTIDNNGYYNYDKNLIHILVAKIFLIPSLNFNIVNHIDGNKLNNHYKNLEWTDNKGNVVHAIKNGLRKNIKKIAHIDINNNIINIYNSCSEASRDLNVNCRSVNKCCKGLLKSCGIYKYIFKYLDNNTECINSKIMEEIKIPNKIKKEKNNAIKIDIYTRNGTYLDTCNSILHASKKYKVNNKTIVSHCKLQVMYSNLDIYF